MNAVGAINLRTLPGVDPVLAGTGIALILVGLIAIRSASIEYADWHFGNPWHHTQRHLFYIALALVAAVITYRVPPTFWEQTGWAWLLARLRGWLLLGAAGCLAAACLAA